MNTTTEIINRKNRPDGILRKFIHIYLNFEKYHYLVAYKPELDNYYILDSTKDLRTIIWHKRIGCCRKHKKDPDMTHFNETYKNFFENLPKGFCFYVNPDTGYLCFPCPICVLGDTEPVNTRVNTNHTMIFSYNGNDNDDNPGNQPIHTNLGIQININNGTHAIPYADMAGSGADDYAIGLHAIGNLTNANSEGDESSGDNYLYNQPLITIIHSFDDLSSY